MVIDVTIKVVEPINILPDGTRDPNASHWNFGGTSYLVKTDKTTYEVHQHKDKWVDICYELSNTSLAELISDIEEIDTDLAAEYERDIRDDSEPA